MCIRDRDNTLYIEREKKIAWWKRRKGKRGFFLHFRFFLLLFAAPKSSFALLFFFLTLQLSTIPWPVRFLTKIGTTYLMNQIFNTILQRRKDRGGEVGGRAQASWYSSHHLGAWRPQNFPIVSDGWWMTDDPNDSAISTKNYPMSAISWASSFHRQKNDGHRHKESGF